MARRITKDDVWALLPRNPDNAISISQLVKELNTTTGSVRYYLLRLQEDGFAEQLADRKWIATGSIQDTTDEEDAFVFVDAPADETVIGYVEEPVSDEQVVCMVDSSQDVSTLNIPQTFMRLSELYAHLAVLTSITEAYPPEQQADVEDESCCGGDESCCSEDESCLSGELQANCDMGLEIVENKNNDIKNVTVFTNLVYRPDDYRSVLGKMFTTNVYLKNVVDMFERIGFGNFNKSDIAYWFSMLYTEETATLSKGKQSSRVGKQETAINNKVYNTLLFLTRTGCLKEEKDGKYHFITSPLEMFNISIYNPADNWL